MNSFVSVVYYLKLSFLVLLCSSSGTNLETSTFVLEIIFAVLIAIGGLVLFSLLIGNMQVIN